MQIGEVIRKYRKSSNMTQEDLAKRLGVTAPAVNKWENGNSMPDITLLAPIARLLDISLDTLLSFRGELTDKEASDLVEEASRRLETEDYDTVFQWAKKQMEQYPNCEHLLLWMAVVLDANRLTRKVPDAKQYEDFIAATYERLLKSSAQDVRNTAADSLYGTFMRREQYDKAEEYLQYFSKENPERKRKQAMLYEKTGRIEEAYQAYEELLFSGYQMINVVFHSLFTMRLKENNFEKADYLTAKMKQLERLFEMGECQEYVSELELMQAKKDVAGTLNCARHILSGCEDMVPYSRAPLYEHMTWKDISEEFVTGLREKLVEGFRDETEFGYMKMNEDWSNLLKLGNETEEMKRKN